MTATRVIALVALLAACHGTEGDVLSSLTSDGGAPLAPDAATPTDIDAGGGPVDAGGGGDIDASGGDIDAGLPVCGDPAPCPTPAPGRLTVCGNVVDLADSTVIEDSAVTVSVISFLELSTNPTNPTPLISVEPDACGRFETPEIGAVFPSLVVISTDDADAVGGPFRRVASIVDAPAGQPIVRNAYALRTTTDVAWAVAAGLLLGTFADQGAFVPIFIDVTQPAVGPFQGTPVADVAMVQNGLPSGDDFYFTDADPLQRAIPNNAAATTGSNGTGIWGASNPSNVFEGTKVGCTFDNASAIGLPTFVQVQELLGS